MPEDLHFKDEESYRKWNSYRHIHGIPSKAKSVYIGKRKHKVRHGKRDSKRE